MPGFGDAIQKAIYLGVGLASYAGEKAGSKLSELQSQIQKLADDMVERGEMTTEDARHFVEEMMSKAQQPPASGTASPTTEAKPSEPRRIEILSEDDPSDSDTAHLEDLRRQVLDLQEELRRLKRD
ncbi:hypothetical protein BST81_12600 [Leptolyngbya sp. 'hensonii']|uniref:phasin family protein n=1 Tax=Leptolyngbya sp. 'hensonii' TaxID=1922337 RepID=UPI00094F7C8B|nr:hypothetical protein [Leptolyngbya sp. 'hensonii']OLP17892.1 hypothetical protein BST81_12600 [Leptolyngbya sp. 'hensonii']